MPSFAHNLECASGRALSVSKMSLRDQRLLHRRRRVGGIMAGERPTAGSRAATSCRTEAGFRVRASCAPQCATGGPVKSEIVAGMSHLHHPCKNAGRAAGLNSVNHGVNWGFRVSGVDSRPGSRGHSQRRHATASTTCTERVEIERFAQHEIGARRGEIADRRRADAHAHVVERRIGADPAPPSRRRSAS